MRQRQLTRILQPYGCVFITEFQDGYTAFIGLFFRGVEAGFDKSFIAANIVSGRVPSFSSDSISNDSILVSASTASALQVRAGDRVYAYFFDNNLRARRFVVSGIFQTNMADFDSKMCFTSMRTAQQLNRWQKDQFSGGEIILKDFSHVEKVSGQVSSMLSRKQDDYGQYYSSVSGRTLSADILMAHAFGH